jgi:hypothetical protein
MHSWHATLKIIAMLFLALRDFHLLSQNLTLILLASALNQLAVVAAPLESKLAQRSAVLDNGYGQPVNTVNSAEGSVDTASPPNSLGQGSILDPIPPLAQMERPWPSPSLNPGVPSAFISNWGDIFVSGSVGSAGKLRDNVDGAWVAGFGIGDATKSVALETAGGCEVLMSFVAMVE